MEGGDAKTLRSAVRILEALESQSIAYVTHTGPLDLRRDTLADEANAQLLAEIQDLELAELILAQVISQKKAMLANVANRRTHVSALPPEILSMVFIEGYRISSQQHRHGFDKIQDFRGVSPTTYLVTVSSVCRRWRETAVSTSGLWTQLDLKWSPAQCRLWITRSGTTRSLDLGGNHSLDNTHGVTKDAASFDIIAPALLRWRSISLRNCSQVTVLRVFHRINEVRYNCDHLEEIEIKSYDSYFAGSPGDGSLDVVLWSNHASNEAIGHKTMFPRLRSIILLPGEYSLRGMLSNVVHLELHQPRSMSWQHWHSILTEASALETLCITAQCEMPVDHPLLLQMDHLHSLDIGTASHDTFMQCWFQNVNAPLLRELSFEHSWRPEDVGSVNAERLCDFISRSPLLTALTLRAENSFVAQVLTLLSSITNTPLAEKLEKLSLFTKRAPDVNPSIDAVRQFVTRHLRRPESHQALDTLIVSDETDRAWLESHVGDLQLQDIPPSGFYSNIYHLSDYSDHGHFVLHNEGDEEDDSDEFGYFYNDLLLESDEE